MSSLMNGTEVFIGTVVNCSPDKNSVFGSNKCVWKLPLTVTEKIRAEIQNTDDILPCSMYCFVSNRPEFVEL